MALIDSREILKSFLNIINFDTVTRTKLWNQVDEYVMANLLIRDYLSYRSTQSGKGSHRYGLSCCFMFLSIYLILIYRIFCLTFRCSHSGKRFPVKNPDFLQVRKKQPDKIDMIANINWRCFQEYSQLLYLMGH